MTSYRTGLKAESLAVLFLRLKGYRILAQRHKTPLGEIDLIARRGRTIAFVEVKTRGTIAAALESVRARQAGRIVRAAQYWLSSRDPEGMDLRFDVIAIELPFKIKHIESAFTA